MPQSETESFFKAIAAGERETVEAMLASSAALARARNGQGVSAVLFARYCNYRDLSRAIRAHIDELDVFEAAALGDLPELRRNLAGDPSLADSYSGDGFTPLHLAAFFGRLAAVNILVASGADPDAVAKNPTQVRPLHSAAASRKAGVLRAVLGSGADPDARQQGGFTALLAAAKLGNYGMVAALLADGADPSLATDDATTPLDFARQSNAPRVVSLLERAAN